MDGLGLRHGGQPPALRQPVGRNTQNQLRPGKIGPEPGTQRLPTAAVFVVAQRVHRAAVANENHRHPVGFFQRGQTVKCLGVRRVEHICLVLVGLASPRLIDELPLKGSGGRAGLSKTRFGKKIATGISSRKLENYSFQLVKKSRFSQQEQQKTFRN